MIPGCLSPEHHDFASQDANSRSAGKACCIFRRAVMTTIKKRLVLAPQQELHVPRGPWTKQMKSFPASFCEASITKHEENSGAAKHCISGYWMFKADVSSVLMHQGSDTTFVKRNVQASFTLSNTYQRKLCGIIKRRRQRRPQHMCSRCRWCVQACWSSTLVPVGQSTSQHMGHLTDSVARI